METTRALEPIPKLVRQLLMGRSTNGFKDSHVVVANPSRARCNDDVRV
jgi:hypothetical protein